MTSDWYLITYPNYVVPVVGQRPAVLRAPQLIDSSLLRWGFWKMRPKWGAELAIEGLWHHNQTVRGTGGGERERLVDIHEGPLCLGQEGYRAQRLLFRAAGQESWGSKQQLLES